MSIRIHKLAEELGLDNKEMMALLKERRIIAQDVKSVSSTVDNINASALREEFAAKNVATAPLASADAEPAMAAAQTASRSEGATAEAPAAKVVIPSVRSKLDIDREKEAAVAARAAALKAAATLRAERQSMGRSSAMCVSAMPGVPRSRPRMPSSGGAACRRRAAVSW